MNLPLGVGTLDWDGWIYGLLSAIISGGASAIVAGGAAAIVVHNIQLRQALAVSGATFVAAGLFSGANYLIKQPLPGKTVTTTTTTQEAGPPSRVTVVEEKEVLPPPAKTS